MLNLSATTARVGYYGRLMLDRSVTRGKKEKRGLKSLVMYYNISMCDILYITVFEKFKKCIQVLIALIIYIGSSLLLSLPSSSADCISCDSSESSPSAFLGKGGCP